VTLPLMLEAEETTATDVSAHLAGLTPAGRLAESLALAPAQQRRLWQLASTGPSSGGGELVIGGTGKFAGRNSLRLFSRFEKWFARERGTIVGCNRHPLSPLIGPGYFTVRDAGDRGLAFDYATVPGEAPAGWPQVAGNSGLFARPVYGNLLDHVRWVGPDVLIGAAFRAEVPLDSYFILIRQA
jgi:hypothetical protein